MEHGTCKRCNGTGRLPLFSHTYQCEYCIEGRVYDPDPADTLDMFIDNIFAGCEDADWALPKLDEDDGDD